MYKNLILEKISYFVLLLASMMLCINGIADKNVLKFLNVNLSFIFYGLTIFCVIYNCFRRDYYLPFLGKTVFPCKSLKIVDPTNATLAVHLRNLKPNINVVFWASERKDKDIVVENPWDAYDKNANSGVCLSDEQGNAHFKIREPVAYRIPTGTVLQKHVHYRECIGNGMLGPVKTKYI